MWVFWYNPHSEQDAHLALLPALLFLKVFVLVPKRVLLGTTTTKNGKNDS
jgi:hypothetical protein